jgi:hypothetical protein
VPRVSPALRAQLAAALAPLDTPERRARYLAGDYPRADLTRDLDRRYRWDLFWALPRQARIPITAAVRTDASIDTALRLTVPPLSPTTPPPSSPRPPASPPPTPGAS